MRFSINRRTANNSTALAAITLVVAAACWGGWSTLWTESDRDSRPQTTATFAGVDQDLLSAPVRSIPVDVPVLFGEIDVEEPEPEQRFVTLLRHSSWRSPGYAPDQHERSHQAAGILNARLILLAPKSSPPV